MMDPMSPGAFASPVLGDMRMHSSRLTYVALGEPFSDIISKQQQTTTDLLRRLRRR